MMAATPIDEEFRTAWPVVLACFATAVFAWGFISYGQPVYLAELQRMHGGSAGTIGGATTVSFIFGAGLLPWVGARVRRPGNRAGCAAGGAWQPHQRSLRSENYRAMVTTGRRTDVKLKPAKRQMYGSPRRMRRNSLEAWRIVQAKVKHCRAVLPGAGLSGTAPRQGAWGFSDMRVSALVET